MFQEDYEMFLSHISNLHYCMYPTCTPYPTWLVNFFLCRCERNKGITWRLLFNFIIISHMKFLKMQLWKSTCPRKRNFVENQRWKWCDEKEIHWIPKRYWRTTRRNQDSFSAKKRTIRDHCNFWERHGVSF